MSRSESAIQQSIVIWFTNNYCTIKNTPKCAIFSVPNEMAMYLRGALMGAKISSRTIDRVVSAILSKMKKTGMMNGVSDLIVLLPEKVIFVECKTETGTQSKSQKTFEKLVTSLGLSYYLVRNLEDFTKIIDYELSV